MKFCPVVSEICRGHVHVARKERRRIIIIIKIIIIRRNGAKTISLSKRCLGDLIITNQNVSALQLYNFMVFRGEYLKWFFLQRCVSLVNISVKIYNVK
jgi:hypothetical protein